MTQGISADSPPLYVASAPATVMLAGEHAVLHGKHALVGALDKRLTVALTPRGDRCIEIHSDRLGVYTTTVDTLTAQHPFHFILQVLQSYQQQLPSGCTVTIHSEFSHQVGFGSSAALTVAALQVIKQWLQQPFDRHQLLVEARHIVQQCQDGLGSGADVAASVFGGVVFYRRDPGLVQLLPAMPPLTLVYIGYKTPTSEVVQLVEKSRREAPLRYAQLFAHIDDCTVAAKQAIEQQDWCLLGEIFQRHQQWQVELGVSTEDIDALIGSANAHEQVMGTKISGSGLGDSVVCIGQLPLNYFPRNKQQQVDGVRQYDLQLTSEGLRVDTLPEAQRIYG